MTKPQETKDVTVLEPVVGTIETTTPATLLEIAVTQGADLDKLEKLMALQERWEANEARKAYHVAMAGFKSNPPTITKDKHVSFKTQKGVTEYDHTTLGHLTSAISAALSVHGLTAAWETGQEDKAITVTCRITHISGHSESTSLTAHPDDSGGKNRIQAVGSTISYLQRYTLMALCGIAAQDQDDDGNSAVGTITGEQAVELFALLEKSGADLDGFLKFFKVEDLEALPAKDLTRAKTMLQEKIKKAKAPKKAKK